MERSATVCLRADGGAFCLCGYRRADETALVNFYMAGSAKRNQVGRDMTISGSEKLTGFTDVVNIKFGPKLVLSTGLTSVIVALADRGGDWLPRLVMVLAMYATKFLLVLAQVRGGFTRGVGALVAAKSARLDIGAATSEQIGFATVFTCLGDRPLVVRMCLTPNILSKDRGAYLGAPLWRNGAPLQHGTYAATPGVSGDDYFNIGRFWMRLSKCLPGCPLACV